MKVSTRVLIAYTIVHVHAPPHRYRYIHVGHGRERGEASSATAAAAAAAVATKHARRKAERATGASRFVSPIIVKPVRG